MSVDYKLMACSMFLGCGAVWETGYGDDGDGTGKSHITRDSAWLEALSMGCRARSLSSCCSKNYGRCTIAEGLPLRQYQTKCRIGWKEWKRKTEIRNFGFTQNSYARMPNGCKYRIHRSFGWKCLHKLFSQTVWATAAAALLPLPLPSNEWLRVVTQQLWRKVECKFG